ncbi:MAG: precorrin-3B C(17)-methyltransferase [Proteobacteria bacterium]|nr:precorrin-3B C(17)-methyltransferase [Pseudomonadota bacterium]
MTGSLVVVGTGPGKAELMTPATQAALARATDLVGYGPYLDRIPAGRADQRRHASDNRVELDRARHALELAASGHQVAVVSGGDPGVFAMAAAVFEAVEAGDPAWRSLDIRVEPGVTAMLAAAAEVGAPLGGDFCAISLSDNLKSWATIERRLAAAAEADFVIALYNPASKARPHQIGQAFDLLRAKKRGETPVLFVRAAGTAEARVVSTTLGEADPSIVDMRTLVIIGASTTRQVGRWIYTPRSERGGA